jgi:hypothetical protein
MANIKKIIIEKNPKCLHQKHFFGGWEGGREGGNAP